MTSPAQAVSYLDNTALDDMASYFEYSISLGSETDKTKCQLDLTEDWPFGAPENWDDVGLMEQRSLFYIVADFDNLRACGFDVVESATGITLQGVVSLFLLPYQARSDSLGTTTPLDAPQMTLQAQLTVVFDDSTHASISSVSVDNVVVVESISTSVTVSSAIQLYSEAFLVTLDTSLVTFTAETDSFHVEHYITSNTDNFYLQLERMWFSPGELVSDDIEFLVPPASPAYTNADSPAIPGRYRFDMTVPYLMNCKPCYMHLVSSLSAVTDKALGDEDAVDAGTKKYSRSSFPVFIGELSTPIILTIA